MATAVLTVQGDFSALTRRLAVCRVLAASHLLFGRRLTIALMNLVLKRASFRLRVGNGKWQRERISISISKGGHASGRSTRTHS